MSKNAEIDDLFTQIEKQLKISDEVFTKIDSDVSIIKSYPHKVKDYMKYIGKEYKYLERIERMKEKNVLLNSQIEKELENIGKSKNKIADLKQHIEKLHLELQDKKKLAEDLDATFDFLGLHIINKEDSIYSIQLSKLPIKDYDLIFSFDIYHNRKSIKILKIDPENCIDTSDIIDQIESSSEDKKFLNLILMIRRELIRRYS